MYLYYLLKYLQGISLENIYNNNVVHFPGCILSNRYSLQYQSKSKIALPRSWNYKRKPCWFTLQTILQRNGPKSYKRRARIYLQHSYFRGNADKILAFLTTYLPLDIGERIPLLLKGKICIFLTFPLVFCSIPCLYIVKNGLKVERRNASPIKLFSIDWIW